MKTALLFACLLIAGCGEQPQQLLGGDARNGKLLLRQFACGACHRIPGVAEAQGNIGPPLEGIAKRVYLAGVVPNTPENMVAWIRHPEKFAPQTAMSNLQVTEAHARDMVAYLHSLE